MVHARLYCLLATVWVAGGLRYFVGENCCKEYLQRKMSFLETIHKCEVQNGLPETSARNMKTEIHVRKSK